MKSLVTIVCIFLFSSSAVAQHKDPVVAGQTSSTGLLFKGGTTHAFGTIKQNVPVTYTFECTNTSKDTITILSVKPGCSCTISDFTKDPIAPGKKGLVKVSYDAHITGKFSKGVIVTTDKEDTMAVIVTGEVVQ